ncbi:hypothetical protein BDA96_02G347000 [Sorghum bicolor]|uniref:Uncharacterized protein n=1 Tax=Sorghum bicolor TaxID=4558 RepID=A0A921UUN6_SORBI|nr:hypothetical protein BDA96_02G347000 [Sorghum bicolor]
MAAPRKDGERIGFSAPRNPNPRRITSCQCNPSFPTGFSAPIAAKPGIDSRQNQSARRWYPCENEGVRPLSAASRGPVLFRALFRSPRLVCRRFQTTCWLLHRILLH